MLGKQKIVLLSGENIHASDGSFNYINGGETPQPFIRALQYTHHPKVSVCRALLDFEVDAETRDV